MASPLNILYTSTLYPPAVGGAQIHLHRLATEAMRLGHGVQVMTHACRNRRDWLRMTTLFPEPARQFELDGVPVSQLGFGWQDRLRMAPGAAAYYALQAAAVRRISRIIGGALESAVPDAKLSVVHASRIGREFLTQAGLDLARRLQIPFLLTTNHHPRWSGWRYREFDRIYREADALIALTEAEKRLLVEQKQVDPDKVHVTGIGPILADEYCPQQFRERYQLDQQFVLFLGQQLKYKGLETVLRAAPRVWRDHPDLQFVFAGPVTSYSRRLFSRHPDPRIHNLGCVDLRTKTSALAACELLCLPSRQESFGGVFVEAWAHGKPVIGADIPPIAEVIDHGENGFLIGPGKDAGTIAGGESEVRQLTQYVCQLLAEPGLRQTMGDAGRAKVMARFTWEKLAQYTLGIYCGMLDGTREWSKEVPAAAEDLVSTARCEGALNAIGNQHE